MSRKGDRAIIAAFGNGMGGIAIDSAGIFYEEALLESAGLCL